jgi:general L-amino acid transport system permease protein
LNALEFTVRVVPSLVLGLPAERPGGLILSLALGLAATGVGFALAVPLGLVRDRGLPILAWLGASFVELVRGIPLVYLVLLVHTFGSRGLIGYDLSPKTSAAIALTLYATVYQAEIVRAGLRSVTRGDVEAALATGLPRRHVLAWIELPLALARMTPAFVSLAISMVKDSSVVLLLGVTDLMGVARLLGATAGTANLTLLYALTGLLYLGTAIALGWLGGALERRLGPAAGARPVLDPYAFG